MKNKLISDHTDRELLEKSVLYQKQAADNTRFIKAYIIVVGIAASGRTPYVWSGLKTCRENNISTGCIVCNSDSEVAKFSDFPTEIIVGPEFVTGSTRMKAGTAQKLVLNYIHALFLWDKKLSDIEQIHIQKVLIHHAFVFHYQ